MFGNSEIENLQSVLENLFRVGRVTTLLPKQNRARVLFEDRDDTQSYDLQVIVKNTKKNKDYWMPDIDEDVLCLFLPIGIEQGFIIGSFYTNSNSRPADTEDIRNLVFSDGTKLQYNREAHHLLADLGESKIEADKSHIFLQSNGCSIDISADGIRMIGPVTQTGGDMTSDGVSAQHHTHGGVVPGGANTDDPN